MECTLSKEAMNEVSNRVGESYASSASIDDVRVRSGYAAALSGCTPIGVASVYAGMVAVPKDLPEVVVKVCANPRDGYILFALLCLQGKFPEPIWPRVHSATKVGNAWVFLIERLEEARNDVDDVRSFQRGESRRYTAQLRERLGEYASSVCIDDHRGNFMRRKDGTMVLMDPVAEMPFDIGEDGVPVKLQSMRKEIDYELNAGAPDEENILDMLVKENRLVARDFGRVEQHVLHMPTPRLQNGMFLKGVEHGNRLIRK